MNNQTDTELKNKDVQKNSLFEENRRSKGKNMLLRILLRWKEWKVNHRFYNQGLRKVFHKILN